MRSFLIWLTLITLCPAQVVVSTGNHRKIFTSAPTSPVSGMNVWYSADCITFVSSVCGTPSSGSTISSWADRSGNANNLTVAQGTATFNTNQVGGQPAVTLASSFEGNMASAVASANGHTAFIVFSTTNNTKQFAFGSAVSGFGYFVATTTSAQGVDRQNSSNVGVATDTATSGVFIQQNVVVTNAASSFAINFRTSSAIDTTTTSTSSSITVNGPSTVGYDPIGTPSAFFVGKIAELIMYNQTLTLTQIQQNEAYFRGKYGIS